MPSDLMSTTDSHQSDPPSNPIPQAVNSSPSTPRWIPTHFSAIAHFEPTSSLDLSTTPPTRQSSRPTLTSFNSHAQHNIPQTACSHSTESTSSILHDVLFTMLPSLISPHPIRRTFPRNLDLSLRASISFAVAAVLALQPWAVTAFGVPYLVPVLSAIMIRPTVGSTVMGMDSQGKGVLLAMIVDLIIIGAQIGTLTHTNRVITVELLLFVTGALLAHFYRPPLARRFSLALHALVMIEVAVGVSSIYLPLQIMACFVMSYAICLLLTLLPFPRLAKDELLDRYQQALYSISTIFSHLVQAYLETGPIAPTVLNTTAQAELDGVFKSLTIMRRLQAELQYEPSIFTWFFPASISLASPVVASPERIERLFWITSNLQHTIAALHYSNYHAAFAHFLRPALLSFSLTQSEYLRALSMKEPSDVDVKRVMELRDELDQRMEECWAGFTTARSNVYGYGRGNPREEGIAKVTGDQEVMDGGMDKPSIALYHTSREVFIRSCFLFYIARYHVSLKMVTDDLTPPPTPSSSHYSRKFHAIQSSILYTLSHPSAWSLFGTHPLSDLYSLLTSFCSFLLHPSIDRHWLKNSVKIALIVCLASLISVIPQLQAAGVFPDSLWAAFTAAVLASDTEGAMWQRGIYRLMGTLLGGVVGWLILLCCTGIDSPQRWYIAVPLLSLWNIPMQFVQASFYNYLGALAAFTPIVIVLGYTPTIASVLTPERFALERMMEICIGVVIALCLSSVLWPVSSIRLLRSEMLVSMAAFQSSIDKTMHITERMTTRYEARQRKRQPLAPSNPSNPITEEHKADPSNPSDYTISVTTQTQIVDTIQDIKEEDEMLQSLVSHSHSVQMSLSRQSRLLTEAVHEPITVFTAFPTDAYKQLASTQRRIWSLIITLEPALRTILEEQMRHQVEGDSVELFDVPMLAEDLRRLGPQVLKVLDECAVGVESGRLSERGGVRGVASSVQRMEVEFAKSMNQLAAKVRDGRMLMMKSQAIVALAVFLYSAAQLAEQVLIMEAQVRRLLELERPKGYDD